MPVVLHEMRPQVGTDAHRTDGFAELVDRDHSAYAFMLRDAEGELVGAVGVVFRDPERPRYEGFTTEGLGMSVAEKLKGLERELDKFAV